MSWSGQMSNQQILTKAIEKAQANGFMSDHRFDYSKNMGWTYVLREPPKQTPGGLSANVTGMLSEGDIIFNHDFAKALWGEDVETYTINLRVKGTKTPDIPHYKWQRHLQNMVVADDPVKYLGENI